MRKKTTPITFFSDPSQSSALSFHSLFQRSSDSTPEDEANLIHIMYDAFRCGAFDDPSVGSREDWNSLFDHYSFHWRRCSLQGAVADESTRQSFQRICRSFESDDATERLLFSLHTAETVDDLHRILELQREIREQPKGLEENNYENNNENKHENSLNTNDLNDKNKNDANDLNKNNLNKNKNNTNDVNNEHSNNRDYHSYESLNTLESVSDAMWSVATCILRLFAVSETPQKIDAMRVEAQKIAQSWSQLGSFTARWIPAVLSKSERAVDALVEEAQEPRGFVDRDRFVCHATLLLDSLGDLTAGYAIPETLAGVSRHVDWRGAMEHYLRDLLPRGESEIPLGYLRFLADDAALRILVEIAGNVWGSFLQSGGRFETALRALAGKVGAQRPSLQRVFFAWLARFLQRNAREDEEKLAATARAVLIIAGEVEERAGLFWSVLCDALDETAVRDGDRCVQVETGKRGNVGDGETPLGGAAGAVAAGNRLDGRRFVSPGPWKRGNRGDVLREVGFPRGWRVGWARCCFACAKWSFVPRESKSRGFGAFRGRFWRFWRRAARSAGVPRFCACRRRHWGKRCGGCCDGRIGWTEPRGRRR